MTPHGPTSSDDAVIEEHRSIVRELDKAFASVYGFGGMGVLVFAAVPVAVAWMRGWLATFGTWIVAITFGLIGLYLLRTWVRRRRRQLRERFESYCQVNGLEVDPFADYFRRTETFPYFVALFEHDAVTSAPAETVDET